MSTDALPELNEAEPSADENNFIPVEPNSVDGPGYFVDTLLIEFRPVDHPLHPSREVILNSDVALLKSSKGYIAPRLEAPTTQIKLNQISQLRPQRFYASAIKAIQDQIVSTMNRQGLYGVMVSPHPDDIDPRSLRDLRPPASGVLRLVIQTGIVTQVHTIAAGERIPVGQEKDNPRHNNIVAYSPIRSPDPNDPRPADLLQKELLDNYLYYLNRHPGRRVDASISSAGAAGELALEYLVSENRPYLGYYQILNTGTKETHKWRQRFGLIHNQLTNNDDILNVSYITAWFDDVQALVTSYEAPLSRHNNLRYRLNGIWSKYDASEIGTEGTFNGRECNLGGDLVATVYQKKELFLDAVMGFQLQEIMVSSDTTETSGKELFILPHLGINLECIRETASTLGSLDLEWNCAGMAGTGDVDKLGRTDAQSSWVVVHWNIMHSFYLEPLLDRRAWEDPTTWETSTLAHELSFSFKGQYADERLIPQAKQSVGGFYTVRGYPEALTSGDSVMIGNAEYRFHLPRTFTPRLDHGQTKLFGKPFRWAPQRVYARPDWDLIFRSFIDIARVRNADKTDFEYNGWLIGAGLGIELQVTRHFSLRCDWGNALRSVEAGDDVDAGDCQVHFVGTLIF